MIAAKKIVWNPYFYSAEMTLAQLVAFSLAQLVTTKNQTWPS